MLTKIYVNFVLALTLICSAAVVQISALSCAACPTVPGDSRCTLLPFSTVNAANNGDCTCGCQRCPDLKNYPVKVKDFCNATSVATGQCANEKYGPAIATTCLIACLKDSRCTTLPFDRTEVSCGCACQNCDGKIYGPTQDYTTSTPIDESKCPHVKHPVPVAQNVC